ncbi:DUF2490 domain-containing protein [Cellulophaga sp. E16_2]|uniref:DUF2490 domain-containing protein n=1 Tax=Cellulophaga sp. E16_2 TaxID=2789297 RepID=UPI001A9265DB|nr:DUF2490 domain-containing protein [Cellulophaga sp. E16_2]MBO0591600.1 DUF2490 domain-containing protein [Cellulophaga sp. E16_2]
MKANTRIAYLVLFISLNFFQVIAQKKVTHQQLLWTSYSLKLKLNDNYQIRQEIDQRNYSNPWRQHQTLSRTFFDRQLGKGWNTAIGLTGVIQSLPNDPEVKDYYNQKELRPVLELGYRQPVTEKFFINHRFWSEFRFFEQENDSYEFANTRLRYKLELRYAPIKKVTFKAFDEIFLNVGNTIVYNVFDQNRMGASVQFMPLTNLGFEVGYFNMFQQQKNGIDFYDRNSIKFTIHHTIEVKKNKS